ncbi:MAG: hypothetical protein GY913_00315 [Proteobacteria bacterium]|nr:hypothetical protein [Pseudomonadota bacterium]MCP4915341.1 hypothetical protein [Pseudomonadota bacterium]
MTRAIPYLLGLSLLAACDPDKDGNNGNPIDSGLVEGDSADSVDADGDGYVASEDCDDNDVSVNPGATEICDGNDNNCDGEIDEGVTTTYYQDSDNDGYGDNDATLDACERPAGYVPVGNDCDDGEGLAYPGATETCDEVDNNCDGEIDEGVTTTYYADADSDTYGDPDAAAEACSQPSGHVTNDGDCDDTNAYSFPGNPEVCDEADNDCDGYVDEDVTTTYWVDIDEDDYGDSDLPTEACSLPTGYAEIDGDCDDSEPAANPGEIEICDTIDNDCDGAIDEPDAADASTWYADTDGDGFGDADSSTPSCTQPSGYVGDDTDCDDTDGDTNPGADEYCDGHDDDCDGDIDEDDALDATTWYRDADADGYGDATSTDIDCDQPSGYVGDATDCDDLDDTSYPGGVEVCDGADNDCNGTIDDNPTDGDTYYADSDGDGTGDPDSTTVACDTPSGYTDNDWDCNDTDSGEPVVADVISGSTSGTGSFSDPLDSIQDAVDRSSECVIVMQGTYEEEVDLSGTYIDVTGVEGSDLTWIDPDYSVCSAAALASGTCASWAPAVTVAGGSNATPSLSGFTISGGSGYATVTTASTTCADSSVSTGDAANSGLNTCTVDIYEFCGGGIYIEGDDPSFSDLIIIDNMLPEYEQYKVPGDSWYQIWTYSYGGGLCVDGGTATLSDVEIYENFADQGGGIYVGNSGSVDVTSSYIMANEAADGAGVNGDNGDATFENMVLAFNDADTDGGGAFQTSGGTFTFTNVTAAGNTSSTSGSARGDALYTSSGATTYVYNSIFQGDSANYIAYSGGTTGGTYNDWYNSSTGGGAYGWTAGTGDLATNPKFTSFSHDGNYNNDDLTLKSTSPAIDAGDPATAYSDVDGSTNDMGAWGGPGSDW